MVRIVRTELLQPGGPAVATIVHAVLDSITGAVAAVLASLLASCAAFGALFGCQAGTPNVWSTYAVSVPQSRMIAS